jgi:hypothetical protein
MEPPEVLELNNKEALLAEQQEQQELAVMAALSQLLVQRGEALQVSSEYMQLNICMEVQDIVDAGHCCAICCRLRH